MVSQWAKRSPAQGCREWTAMWALNEPSAGNYARLSSIWRNGLHQFLGLTCVTNLLIVTLARECVQLIVEDLDSGNAWASGRVNEWVVKSKTPCTYVISVDMILKPTWGSSRQDLAKSLCKSSYLTRGALPYWYSSALRYRMAPFAVIGPCFTCVAVSYAKTSAPHRYLTICMAFAWWLSRGGSRVVAVAWLTSDVM